MTTEDTFIEFLNERKARITFGRKAAARIMDEMEGMFSAKELFEALDRKGESVSIASVHNTIPLLKDAGIIEVVEMMNNAVYYKVKSISLTSQELNNSTVTQLIKNYCTDNGLTCKDYVIKLKV